ncbi:hypothetical protein PFMALIP_05924 [Plasmodium falciparum MaliPS096_E11]|uniref:Erythrocyte membrane protein 1, PfEMP1 n=1 Tax=Plasmodium falciparum MaliPS096_E11 TaxID=1036727 RepID=A0A024WHL2_PLAFA|nr:hypothetical protein PFMALIP_05924 [Plasmodium falciparum MaliPS096_E11]
MSSGGGSGGRPGGKDQYKDAKHLLDEFGQQVYKEVKNDADNYSSQLKGDLSQATFRTDDGKSRLRAPPDTCTIVKEYYNNHLKLKRYPCTELGGKIEVNRFSDTLGGQCTDSKMRSDGIGACAPYRRLHLCHHNLETIETKSMTTHDLLLEVCMAAKYEGQSIRDYYTKHELTNPNTKTSDVCTALARSFADIGDIVRGRDIFRGNDKEKEQRKQLDKNLKEIFGKIHNGLSNNGVNSRYKDNKNYYKLREAWWTVNRATIWEAITCEAKTDDKYFRDACGGDEENKSTRAIHQCRCDKEKGGKPGEVNIVPTYFDYVPQFLRWFEEWAEDFCRLRKRKLQNAKEQCRGKNGEDKYCSGNGLDCTQTIRGDLHFVEGECHDCLVACSPFVKWLDNQKLEFLKQKEKYGTEISNSGSCGGSRKKPGTGKSNYDGYESKFYNKLKEKREYQTVDGFLELLNKEEVCTKNTEIIEGGNIDFKNVNSGINSDDDDSNKTFCRTKYCQACPWCAIKVKEEGEWKDKELNCAKTKTFTKENTTEIPVLYPDKGQSDIFQKYRNFCNSSDGKNNKQIKEWQCHYEDVNNDNCVEGTWDNFIQGKQTVKSYNAFFWDWVYHMLHDSLDWRNELGSCINKNKENTCKTPKKCNRECGCFKRWVEQKKEEWGKIKVHFDKQDFGNKGPNAASLMLGTGLTADFVLKTVLKGGNLLQNIKDTHANADDIERIGKMLKEEENQVTGVDASGGDAGGLGGAGFLPLVEGDPGTTGCGVKGANGKNTKIDKFLQEELDEATKCKNCQPTKVKNPCYGDKQYPVVAHKVAADIHKKAHKDMLQRSCKDGDKGGGEKVSLLKGDPEQGQYRGSNRIKLTGGICSIDEKYSNAGNDESKNPCNGKGDGLQIGETWNVQNSKSSIFGVHIRPRREHMCTSNLEKIHDKFVTQNTNDHVNDTFLVDVLLAAKEEAEFIKKKYKEIKDKNGLKDDQVTTCRAIKSSFADIGDIIRGRDLWEHSDQTQLQGHLQIIFGKIKEELKKQHPDKFNGKGKYTGDANHTKLRADWWTANRDQIWEAMVCEKDGIKCDEDPTPVDDYIPQRLRWMTEWAEWFCKDQSRLYEVLLQKCSNCKDKIKGKVQGCTQSTPQCATCTKACSEYTENIKKWEDQWNTMQIPYALSYREAEKGSAGKVFVGTDPDYNQVVDFFEQLQEKYKTATRSSSTTKSPYATPAGYIHQEARTGQCLVQKEFCEYENGVAQNTDGAKENKKYAFKKPPPEYKYACECKERPQQEDGGSVGRNETFDETNVPQPPSDEEEEEDPEDDDEDEDDEDDVATPEGDDKVCGMVKSLLDKSNGGTVGINDCNPKDQVQPYPGWNCTPSTFKEDQKGPCMPPRRQKLCINDLKQLKNKGNIDENDLREAFIKCAAKEIHFLWKKYKDDKTKDLRTGAKLQDAHEPQKQLKDGTIPEDFKRQMFYTFGDYRDLCLGNDLGKHEDTTGISDTVTRILKKEKNGGTPITAETWWDDNSPKIWEAMLCALSYNTEKKGMDHDVRDKLTGSKSNYNYNSIKTNLEKFVKKPQFLRWMIEWGEEFCAERGKLEQDVEKSCSGEHSGNACAKNENSCKTACTEYQGYVKKKYEEFKGQTNNFVQKANETSPDPEYIGYESKNGVTKQGNEYLVKNCDNKKCSCMEGNVLIEKSSEKPFGKYAFPKVQICNCLGGTPSRSELPPAVVPTEQEAEPPPQEAPPKKNTRTTKQ